MDAESCRCTNPRSSCHLVQWPVPGLLGSGLLRHVTCTAAMLLSLCSCWRICDCIAGKVYAGSACNAPHCLLRAQHSPADHRLQCALQPFCTATCTEALPVGRPNTFVYLQMETCIRSGAGCSLLRFCPSMSCSLCKTKYEHPGATHVSRIKWPPCSILCLKRTSAPIPYPSRSSAC